MTTCCRTGVRFQAPSLVRIPFVLCVCLLGRDVDNAYMWRVRWSLYGGLRRMVTFFVQVFEIGNFIENGLVGRGNRNVGEMVDRGYRCVSRNYRCR